jgi:glycosyltransferase involved in cell wall biosynthesis
VLRDGRDRVEAAGGGNSEVAGGILQWLKRTANQAPAFRKALAARARSFFSIERYATENLLVYEEVLEEG